MILAEAVAARNRNALPALPLITKRLAYRKRCYQNRRDRVIGGWVPTSDPFAMDGHIGDEILLGDKNLAIRQPQSLGHVEV